MMTLNKGWRKSRKLVAEIYSTQSCTTSMNSLVLTYKNANEMKVGWPLVVDKPQADCFYLILQQIVRLKVNFNFFVPLFSSFVHLPSTCVKKQMKARGRGWALQCDVHWSKMTARVYPVAWTVNWKTAFEFLNSFLLKLVSMITFRAHLIRRGKEIYPNIFPHKNFYQRHFFFNFLHPPLATTVNKLYKTTFPLELFE